MQCFNFATLSGVTSYLLHGCLEPERLMLSHNLAPCLELIKTGPVLPGILSFAYMISGKPADTSHWQIGTIAMIVCQSLTVSMVWLLARRIAGTTAARVAAIIALTYPALVVNCGRLLTEMPAMAIVSFASWLLVAIFTGEESETKSSYGAILRGFALGATFGLLMLGRPNLVLLPVLILPSTFILQRIMKAGNFFSLKWLLGLILGFALLLGPWALCKQILTGHPSVSIDRNGPWNITAGCGIKEDGFDVQPYASHPERFMTTMSDAVHNVVHDAAAQPAAFVWMMMRKPARLFDAPWNDFQIPCWGIPWWAQRLAHIAILLLAAVGALCGIDQGARKKKYALVVPPFILFLVVAYHLINCAFISMFRYSTTALPALFVLAALGIEHAVRLRKEKATLGLAVCGVALLASLHALAYQPDHPDSFVPGLAHSLGTHTLALVGAFAVTALMAAWFFFLFRMVEERLPRFFCVATGFLSCLFAFCAVWFQLITVEAPLTFNLAQHPLKVEATINATESARKYYVMVDLASRLSHSNENWCSAMAVSVNGKELPDQVRTWFETNMDLRETLMYQCQFAHAAEKNVQDFRQWYCMPVPSHMVRAGAANEITLSCRPNVDTDIQVFGDFRAHPAHDLSLSEFSWTKGFFINAPGDIRLDRFKAEESSVDVTPRVYLISVPAESAPDTASARPSPKSAISVPDIKVGPGFRPMVETVIDEKQLPGTASAFIDAWRIKVSGEIRCVSKPVGTGSVCLLEHLRTQRGEAEVFCPTAPLKLKADGEWRRFAFEDRLPLIATPSMEDANNSRATLTSLRILQGARSWWDVLQYGAFKGRSAVEYRDVKLEIEPAEDVYFGRGDIRVFPSQLISTR